MKDLASPPARLYVDEIGLKSRLRRLAWETVSLLLFRTTPRFGFNRWRLFLLRRFGAVIGPGCKIASSCAVWAPWNLTMGAYACLADGVDCYAMAPIVMGDYSTVSQRAFLCGGSHDIRLLERPLVVKPIRIEAHAWVCSESFVGPGVTVGEGAIVAARAAVFRDVEPWTVVGGNPAVKIKDRVIAENADD